MADVIIEPGTPPQDVVDTASMCRKEKRKAVKKLKRRQMRKDTAQKDLHEELTRMNDPEEQRRIQLVELEEKERMEREHKLFEEREREWIQAIQLKKKKIDEEKEERRRRELEEDAKKQQAENEDEFADEGWEYVEGPAEIIWQGNEITVKKKRIRVPKKDVDLNRNKEGSSLSFKPEDADRPTSNPFPPDSEAFAGDASILSAQALIENVAQQVPNFGTEQDKAHCPFHLKTGACRFGQRCSRVHFYPDKSCTLLMKNMYTGPGLAWDQDEGLEFMDEEVERSYEEFYEDVHTEFLKFGEIVNFKVCKNGSFHLRGNVYVHYRFLDSAELAFRSLNGRFFAGKQITCEFINVTRWKVAICGEYMKSRFKTCSHGTACNFIHCFRNPGGDYEWADIDKPPPRYWIKKMAALFSYSHEQLDEMLMDAEQNTSKGLIADGDSYHSRRSKSRDIGWGRRNDTENDSRKNAKYATESAGEQSVDRNGRHGRKRKTSSLRNIEINNTTHEADYNRGRPDEDADTRRSIRREDDRISEDRSKIPRHESKVGSAEDYSDRKNRLRCDESWIDREREEEEADRYPYRNKTRESSRRHSKTREGLDRNADRRENYREMEKGKTSKWGGIFRLLDESVEPYDVTTRSEKVFEDITSHSSNECSKETDDRWAPESFVEAFE